MECTDCGRWLTSAEITVEQEGHRTYRCAACGAWLPEEQARTELFAWV